jgi:hypothetical protein
VSYIVEVLDKKDRLIQLWAPYYTNTDDCAYFQMEPALILRVGTQKLFYGRRVRFIWQSVGISIVTNARERLMHGLTVIPTISTVEARSSMLTTQIISDWTVVSGMIAHFFA